MFETNITGLDELSKEEIYDCARTKGAIEGAAGALTCLIIGRVLWIAGDKLVRYIRKRKAMKLQED